MSGVVDHEVATLAPPEREGNTHEKLRDEQFHDRGEELSRWYCLRRQVPQPPQRGNNDRRKPASSLLTAMQIGIESASEEHLLNHKAHWSDEEPRGRDFQALQERGWCRRVGSRVEMQDVRQEQRQELGQ